MRCRFLLPLTVLITTLGVGVPSSSAVPAGAEGRYADFSVSGVSGGWRANAEPDVAGFPTAALTSTASSLSRAGGGSAYLGPRTPFGQQFGSSAGLPYLTADSATGRTPSTTTLTFARATPAAGWGFALGDIDADLVTISATDAAGQTLAGAALTDALGWRGPFNYCSTTPKPSACTGAGPFTDVPTWDPARAALVGSGTNTFGAAGWFTPTLALSSITFTFSVQVGSPNYQIWLAALSVPVTGEVAGASPETAGVAMDLLDRNGRPIENADGEPTRAVVDADGSFAIPAVADGAYLLQVDPGDRARVTGYRRVPITIDTARGPVTVAPDTFAIVPIAATTEPPSSTTPPTSDSPSTTVSAEPTATSASTGPPASHPAGSAVSDGSGAGGAVANTGTATGTILTFAVVLLVLGAALVTAARRPRGRRNLGSHR